IIRAPNKLAIEYKIVSPNNKPESILDKVDHPVELESKLSNLVKLSLFSGKASSLYKIKAVFWDIDGTLTDDQIHKHAHRSLAEKAGHIISEAEGMELNGVDARHTYSYFCQKSMLFQKHYPTPEAYELAYK